MRSVKLLGLAAVMALAGAAFVGAGTASADVIWDVDDDEALTTSDQVIGSLHSDSPDCESGGNATGNACSVLTDGDDRMECDVAGFTADVTSAGGASSNPVLTVDGDASAGSSNFVFGDPSSDECDDNVFISLQHAWVTSDPTFDVSTDAGTEPDGTVSFDAQEVVAKLQHSFGTCTYRNDSNEALTATAGSPGTLDSTNVSTDLTDGSCPGDDPQYSAVFALVDQDGNDLEIREGDGT